MVNKYLEAALRAYNLKQPAHKPWFKRLEQLPEPEQASIKDHAARLENENASIYDQR